MRGVRMAHSVFVMLTPRVSVMLTPTLNLKLRLTPPGGERLFGQGCVRYAHAHDLSWRDA